jgi:hypothetical protein
VTGHGAAPPQRVADHPRIDADAHGGPDIE